MNKSWLVPISLAFFLAFTTAYPVPEDDTSLTASEEEAAKNPSIFDDYEEELETKGHGIRSISSSGDPKTPPKDPSAMISKALEDVSETLGSSIKNLGNSAIQILEGTGVAAEQALGTGARIVTGVAETAAEAAETGAKSAIRIAHGVANSLSHGTRSLVETKTQLLKGLTGASSSLQADASSNSEAVQRQERQSYGGYSSTSSYGPNTVAETPNNFVNVFSQAAANTVNFGTQLLNSLVGVAANILQGTVSTLLSLLNAKGQVVGAVVQSAPPVLASVTRTAGDVLAAKARIFGAVTQGLWRLFLDTLRNIYSTSLQVGKKGIEVGQRILNAGRKAGRISVHATSKGIQSIKEAAVSFGSQLARTFGDTFGGLFNRINNIGGSGDGESPTPARGGLGGLLQALGNGNRQSSSDPSGTSANRGLAGILASLQSGGSSRDISTNQGSGLLGGLGNLAQTLINAKLNLVNGFLSPFTGGRPLINFGNRANFGGYSSGSGSESNFRISIASTAAPNPIVSLATEDSSNGPRAVRFFVAPDAPKAPKLDAQLSPANLLSTFSSGIFKGFVDQMNKNLQASLARNAQANSGKGIFGSFDSSNNFAKILQPSKASSSIDKMNSKEQRDTFSRLLPLLYSTPSTTPKAAKKN